MKRYRLKIPEMISRDDADVAYHLQQSGSCEFEDRNGMLVCSQFSFLKRKVPKDWLEEIKACSKCGKDVSNGDWDWLDDWRKERICESCFNEEIKDEPMSPEEWVSKHFKNENAIRAISYDLMVEMLVNYFKAGAAEERKKFKPLIDAVLGNEGFDTLEILARSLKAHNLPEEE